MTFTIRTRRREKLVGDVGISPAIDNMHNQQVPIHVPQFQRPYKWLTTGERQVQTLWNSIFGTVNIIKGQTDQYIQEGDEVEYPFLGTIVLTEPSADEDTNHLEVIDGQQRLTTHLIIAAVLRDHALNLIKKIDVNTHLALSNDLRDIAKQIQKCFMCDLSEDPNTTFWFFKQSSRQDQKIWFQNRIQSYPSNFNAPHVDWRDWNPPIGSPDKGSDDETADMWKAYTALRKQLGSHLKSIPGCSGNNIDAQGKQAEVLVKMTEKLATSVCYCFINVKSIDCAYLLFETLNNTGLDLSLGDLFKNMLFMRTEEVPTLRDLRNRRWRDVENALDIKPIPDFLRYRHIKNMGKNIAMSKVYNELKKILGDYSNTHLKTVELPQLAEDAKNYSEILLVNCSGVSAAMSCGLYRQLRTFNLFNYKITHPILLAGWSHCENDVQKIKLVQLLESFMFQFSTLGERASNLLETDAAFPTFAGNLQESNSFDEGYEYLRENLRNLIAQEEIDFDEGWDRFAERKNAISKVKPMLYRIEEKINELLNITSNDEFEALAAQLKDTSTINVEHIFPQSWEDHWGDFDPGDKEPEEWVHHIGNLCLLGNRLNKEASNYSLENKKREADGGGYSASQFIVPTELMEMDEWTTESILNNAESYREAAKEIWGAL